MANEPYDNGSSYVSEFTYDLRERGDELTEGEFEKIRKAVLEWGVQNELPVEVRRTRKALPSR